MCKCVIAENSLMAPMFVYHLNRENTAKPFTQLLGVVGVGAWGGCFCNITTTGNTGSQAPWWLTAVQVIL